MDQDIKQKKQLEKKLGLWWCYYSSTKWQIGSGKPGNIAINIPESEVNIHKFEESNFFRYNLLRKKILTGLKLVFWIISISYDVPLFYKTKKKMQTTKKGN